MNKPIQLEVNDELATVVAEAWDCTEHPQTVYARILRNEAKAVGHYNDPGTYAQIDRLRESLRDLTEQIGEDELKRQLRVLARGYEEAPELEAAGPGQ